MTITEVKQKASDLTRGEVTLTRMDFLLIGAVCLLAGICAGLLTAPLTHGIRLFCNNGSHNGNNCGNAQMPDDGRKEC